MEKNLKIKKYMTNFVMTKSVIMLGIQLKELRVQNKLKTQELAQKMGIDQSLISKFEAEIRKPTKEQVLKLADILDAKPNVLMNTWLSDKILEEIKDYAHADEVLSIVSDSIAGYQKLLNKTTQQVLPKQLMKLYKPI